MIGVHGAGMTHVLALPPYGVVLEVVPSRKHIPNKCPNDQVLTTKCGYTMFGVSQPGTASGLGVRDD